MSQLDYEMRNILLDPTCVAKPLLISERRWLLLCSACEAGIGDDTDGSGGGMGSGGVGYVVIEKKQCVMLQPKDGDTSASVLACPRVSFKHDGCKMHRACGSFSRRPI